MCHNGESSSHSANFSKSWQELRKGWDCEMSKKLTALLLVCLLVVCMVLPVSAADAPDVYGTASAAGDTVTVTLSLHGGSTARSGAFALSYDKSLTLDKTEKGLPLMAVNTKENGKVVCNWVGGADAEDCTVLTLTFTKAASKSYTFDVTGAKVTDSHYKTTTIGSFPIKVYVSCNGTNCPSKPFTDVNTAKWYHTAVDYVLGNGIMSGTGATTFGPNVELTRGMMVTVLGRIAGVDTSKYTVSNFDDVKAGSWYGPYVEWARQEGLVRGYSDGTFQPNGSMTREEMVSVLYRYWLSTGHKDNMDLSALDGFQDAGDIALYAVSAMRWAAANEVVHGVSSTKIDPKGLATRAQFAQIIMGYLENLD